MLPNKKYPVILFVLLLFSSCATVFNSPVQKVLISSDRHIKVVSVEKAALTDLPLTGTDATTAYYIPRSSRLLKVNIEVDSLNKSIFIKPNSSFAYWFNIYCNYGIGMLVDKNNPKRYAYPTRNYLTIKDSSIRILKFAPVNKGTIHLSLSLPFVTTFNIRIMDRQYTSAGVFGLEAGLDYFYKDNRYLSINTGAATDRDIGERFGPQYLQTGSSIFASIRSNYVVGSFDLGYGINLSQLKWREIIIGDSTQTGQTIKNTGLGLSFSAQYRLGSYFRLGVLYQPNFWNTSFKPSFNYQHYCSLNLIWKFPIKAGR